MPSLVLALLIAACPGNVHAAQLVRVVDGDTLEVLVDLGFNVHRKLSVRVPDLWCPETRGRERLQGLEAKARAAELLAGQRLSICATKKRTFNRWVSPVTLQGDAGVVDFAAEMVRTSSCSATRLPR